MRTVALYGPRGNLCRVQVPTTRGERLRGLLGRDRLEPGEALLLPRTRSVHTFGMRFTITVALVDRELRVLSVLRTPPGRIVFPRRDVHHVLECAADVDLREGDVLSGEQRAEP